MLTANALLAADVQSKNPILPSGAEIVWGLISFVILFGVLSKFAYPALKKSMDARVDTITSNFTQKESAYKADIEKLQSDLAAGQSSVCWLLGTSVLRKAWILRTDVPRSQHRTRFIKS